MKDKSTSVTKGKKLSVASFDIFDTVLTRKVNKPTDLFYTVGEELARLIPDIPNSSTFHDARVSAEKQLRESNNLGDITIGSIAKVLVNLLKLPSSQTQLLIDTEVKFELDSVIVVPTGKRLLNKARAECDQVIFVSDMYLPRHVIDTMLEKFQLKIPGDIVFVSSDVQASKFDGSLYQHVNGTFPPETSFTHYGDNVHSDIRMAKKFGWRTIHTPFALPNRYENDLPSEQQNYILNSNLLVQMRLKRLSHSTNSNSANSCLYNTGLEILGPLLAEYCLMVSRDTTKHNIENVFCLARDGQLLQLVMDRLQTHHIPFPKRHYLMVSRKALTLPFYAYAGKLPTWVWHDTGHLSAKLVFNRLGMDIQDWWAQLGELNTLCSPDDKLNMKNLNILKSLLETDTLGSALKLNAHRQLQQLTQYLNLHKPEGSNTFAICDVGWTGSLSSAFVMLWQSATDISKIVPGYYVGAKINNTILEENNLKALLKREHPLCSTQAFSELLELLLSADHTGVTEYELIGTSIKPVKDTKSNITIPAEQLSELRQGTIDFINLYAEQIQNRPILDYAGKLMPLVERNFLLLLNQPTSSEAKFLGDFPFSTDITHDRAYPLAPKLSLFTALAPLSRNYNSHNKFWYSAIEQRSGWWLMHIFRWANRIAYHRKNLLGF